jgi:NAD+--asparagine ADP-ribosyltransferase
MLKRAIKVLTNNPTEIKDPVFTKDFSSDERQIKDLEKLLTICDKNAKSFIENDIKTLKYEAVGENNIYYKLKNSFVPMMCMHNLKI